ncbi:GNAT family N-acetyltransferase [Frigoribacterium sp. 2-23]|uniref:GNAT family N-acetyltransferase n=1 Tax=Frigoribacterium sp. 2-23 TaxID=3415006 RepID=UPI003C6F4407
MPDSPTPPLPPGSILTDRLLLSPLADDDVPELHRIFADPDTWQHLPSGRHTALAETAALVPSSEASRRDHGLGRLAVRLRRCDVDARPRTRPGSSPADGFGPVVGVAGATMQSFGAWNVGYRLDPAVWGGGLATEAARASIVAAQQASPHVPVTARALSNNQASVRVMQRAGLQIVWQGTSHHEVETAGLDRVVASDRPLDAETLERLIALG